MILTRPQSIDRKPREALENVFEAWEVLTVTDKRALFEGSA